MGVAFVATLLTSLYIARVPMEPLTPEALQAARGKWREAGVHDYDIRYLMNGATYDVEVRDDIVTDMLVDGKPGRSAEWGLYSVDGLFRLLDMELENLSDSSGPFGQKGQQTIARVRFNERYGYVERYLRSAAPGGKPASIQVIEFAPTPDNG